jgi:ABC-type Fe3+-siderophore transport system permease subunit
MLWQHAFLETRWRFLLGLVVLTISAAFVALGYPQAIALTQGVTASPDSTLGREIAQAIALSKTYDSYVWSQWFRQNGAQLGSFFAVIIGTGGLLSQSAAARLFTLSLPVSRERLLGVRAGAGLAQVLILTFLPALVIVAVSPLVAQRFPLRDALAYGLCAFAGGTFFFSLAFLFSSRIANVWAPVALALCAGVALSMLGGILGGAGLSLLGMMHGESYFNGHGLPWLMLLVSTGLSAALIYAGIRHMARQDF